MDPNQSSTPNGPNLPPPPSIQRANIPNNTAGNPGTNSGYLYAVQEYRNTVPSPSDEDPHTQWAAAGVHFASTSTEGRPSSATSNGMTPSTPQRPTPSSTRDVSTASSPGALEGSSVKPVVSNANFLYPSSSADARGGSSSEDAPGKVPLTPTDGHAGGRNGPHTHHHLGVHYPNYPGSPARSNYFHQTNLEEPEMVDDTYEEYYGDAYISAPIRYIYPSGYGSMRPRSVPWQISVVVCISMSFLTVFIVGHCADQFDEENYYYYGDELTDEIIIKTRWCDSRRLYFMWVLSLLITGFSCAYCSIIGYIKARDFAVANGRSQPPGMVGKSDFYVSVEDVESTNAVRSRSRSGRNVEPPRASGAVRVAEGRHKTLYQADGTPRYLGKHIYKPTQAAVHLTSR